VCQLCNLFAPLQGLASDDNNIQDRKTVSVGVVAPVIDVDDNNGLLISPFIRYEDGYEWPSLYDEIDGAIERNVLIYAIAELRQLSQKDPLLLLGKRSLELPITHEELVDIFEAKAKIP
jgi:hypothetical protein